VQIFALPATAVFPLLLQPFATVLISLASPFDHRGNASPGGEPPVKLRSPFFPDSLGPFGANPGWIARSYGAEKFPSVFFSGALLLRTFSLFRLFPDNAFFVLGNRLP